jgi:hypothetical protein
VIVLYEIAPYVYNRNCQRKLLNNTEDEDTRQVHNRQIEVAREELKEDLRPFVFIVRIITRGLTETDLLNDIVKEIRK